MSIRLEETDQLQHKKPLYCVYRGNRLIAAFAELKVANAFILHLRNVAKRQGMKA